MPWRVGAAALSGLLLVFTFPPFTAYPLVWVALAPLLVACWGRREPAPSKRRLGRLWRSPGAQGFRLGWLSGFVFFCGSFHWLLNLKVFTGSLFIAGLGLVSLSGYLAIYFGIFGAVAATGGRLTRADLTPPAEEDVPNRSLRMFGTSLRSLRAALLLAAAWVGLEWFRGIFLTGFGWHGLGVPLAAGGNSLTMIQICDLVGATGLSFLPVFACIVALATIWRLVLEARARRVRPHPDFGVAMALVTGVFIYGLSALSERDQDDPPLILRTAVVQPNIAQLDKWNPEKAEEIRNALQQCLAVATVQPFDLVVMPEACLPFPIEANRPFLDEVTAAGTTSLVYGSDWVEWSEIPKPGDPPDRFYNSVVLHPTAAEMEAEAYHKMHLVMFGEFVPFSKSVGLFRWFAGLIGVGNLDAGTEARVLRDRTDRFDLIPSVCFEDTVARQTRKFVKEGPQLIVNVTNDAWFGEGAATEQHLVNALFRSVELRRPMVRSTNTGTSALVLPSGKVIRLMPAFVQGTQTTEIPLEINPKSSFYARHGERFSVAMLILASVMLVYRRLARSASAKGRSEG